MEKSEKRYERKYFCKKIFFNFEQLKLLKLNLKKIYKKRKINNIYFDNQTRQSYFNNIDGYGSRYKFRLRWYNNDQKKYFEIKKKDNFLVSKKIIPLGNFLIEYSTITKSLQNFFKKEEIFLKNFVNLTPVTFNSYEREYYLISKDIRMTIDTNLVFTRLINNKPIMKKKMDKDYSIIEFKYPIIRDYYFKSLLRNFTNTNTKFSKYVFSVENNLL